MTREKTNPKNILPKDHSYDLAFSFVHIENTAELRRDEFEAHIKEMCTIMTEEDCPGIFQPLRGKGYSLTSLCGSGDMDAAKINLMLYTSAEKFEPPSTESYKKKKAYYSLRMSFDIPWKKVRPLIHHLLEAKEISLELPKPPSYDMVLLGLIAPGFDIHQSKHQLLAEVRELHPEFMLDVVQVKRNSDWSFECCNHGSTKKRCMATPSW